MAVPRVLVVGGGARALVAHVLLTSESPELPELLADGPGGGSQCSIGGQAFRAFRWTLRTKYYEAELELCVAEDGVTVLLGDTNAPGSGATALVVTFDAHKQPIHCRV